MTTITLRPATADDRAFIDGLSPRLSGVPRPAWHDVAAMEGLPGPAHGGVVRAGRTALRRLIACAEDGRRLGYIHLRPGKDGVTDEPCGYVSLLATTPEAEGTGVAAPPDAAPPRTGRAAAAIGC